MESKLNRWKSCCKKMTTFDIDLVLILFSLLFPESTPYGHSQLSKKSHINVQSRTRLAKFMSFRKAFCKAWELRAN